MVAYFVSLGVSVFAFYLAGLLVKKYRKKKLDMVRNLMLMALFLAIAIFLDPFLLTIFRSLDLDIIAYRFATNIQGHVSFGFVAIANIYLIFFLSNVFLENRIPWYFILLISIQALIFPVGVFMAATEQDTLGVLIVFVISSFTLYAAQIYNSFKLRQRSSVKKDRVAFNSIKYIELSGCFLFGAYVSFLLQEVARQVPEFATYGLIQGNASIFIPLGWILVGIGLFSLYVGYITPDWIKNRWQKRSGKEIGMQGIP